MKVRLPLQPRRVDGIDCSRPTVRFRVRDRYGLLVELEFRVDTQADFTAIPIQIARREGIAFSEARKQAVIGLVGQTTTCRDRVRIVVAGREHDWPCDFLMSPLGGSPQQPSESIPVLGRAGFLDDYAILIDSGYLTITRIGPMRRLWRRWLHALWRRCGMVHSLGKPI